MSDYPWKWFREKDVDAKNQLLLLSNTKFENKYLDKKALKIKFNNKVLTLQDLITIYDEFHVELNKWLKDNNV